MFPLLLLYGSYTSKWEFQRDGYRDGVKVKGDKTGMDKHKVQVCQRCRCGAAALLFLRGCGYTRLDAIDYGVSMPL